MLVVTIVGQHPVAPEQPHLAVAPEGACVERLEEGHVGIAEDQHVFPRVRGNGDAAQLLHMPAAQRLRLQAEPDAAAKQAERIVEGMQPARQQIALVDDGAAAVFQLAKQRHVAMLDQNIVMRHAGNVAVDGFAQQTAALEIRRIAGGHDRRGRRLPKGIGFGSGARHEPAVHPISPAGSDLRENF